MKFAKRVGPVIGALFVLVACVAAPPAPEQPTLAPAATATVAPDAPTDAPVDTPTDTPVAAPSAVSALECSGVPTIGQTEGPMYVANPPQRTNLRDDPRNAGGQPLLLTGFVVDRQCQPIVGARVDIWHTDAQGSYDLSEIYTSRGYTLTDADGGFHFETIFPFIYMGRTAHIHVKITPPGGATLTTQLYFPNEATNSGDAIFEPSLLVTLSETPDGQQASFTFVME
jgi:protocatechuate 3,4-dioxygenase beta subunit